MPDTSPQQVPPAWVTEAVGSVQIAQRIHWGFTNESWRITTKGGTALVVTRMADLGAARLVVERAPAISAALAGVGIAIPIPIPEGSAPRRAVVVSAFIPGRSGMELMGDGQAAASLGRVVGETWLALGRVETAGLDLDDLWARPSDLAVAARRWFAAAGRSVGKAVGRHISRRLDELPRLLAGRPPGFVHGDLVPANVLVGDEQLAALLDLETVRLGERLLDAAWFRWIVRYHHPEIERAAWLGFAGASDVDEADSTNGRLLDTLPIVRILEILGQPSLGSAARERWLDQLRACVRWPDGDAGPG
jgi:aminoglycoside phosphotransferase (APT) family kinase protein